MREGFQIRQPSLSPVVVQETRSFIVYPPLAPSRSPGSPDQAGLSPDASA